MIFGFLKIANQRQEVIVFDQLEAGILPEGPALLDLELVLHQEDAGLVVLLDQLPVLLQSLEVLHLTNETMRG